MSAAVNPIDRRRRQAAARTIAERGWHVVYRPDQVNHCPGCGRSHWYVGRSSAECAFCGTALPIAPASAVNAGCTLIEPPLSGKDR